MRYGRIPKGQAIYPVMVALMEWGYRWPTDQQDPLIALIHRPCARRLKIQMACSACDPGFQISEVPFTLEGAGLLQRKSSE